MVMLNQYVHFHKIHRIFVCTLESETHQTRGNYAVDSLSLEAKGKQLCQGNLPNPGIQPRSPTLRADSLPSEPSGKHFKTLFNNKLLYPLPLFKYLEVSCGVGYENE